MDEKEAIVKSEPESSFEGQNSSYQQQLSNHGPQYPPGPQQGQQTIPSSQPQHMTPPTFPGPPGHPNFQQPLNPAHSQPNQQLPHHMNPPPFPPPGARPPFQQQPPNSSQIQQTLPNSQPPPPIPTHSFPPPSTGHPPPLHYGLNMPPMMGQNGVPMMPPHIIGMHGVPIPYLTAPVVPTPAPVIIPPPPSKRPRCTEPNNTIYIHNLNEKTKIPDLKLGLKKHFSKFGAILDIVAQKNLRMKGQAFVVYSELSSAQRAVEEMNGSPLFNRAMVVQFSHNRSDKIAEREGQLDTNKAERYEKMEKRLETRRINNPVKPKIRNNGQAPMPPKKSVPDHMMVNKILFLQHLPVEIDEPTLTQLFKQYPGFKEVRLVPGRSDIAFVEYDTEVQAAMAKSTLNNYPVLPDHPMKITFAKR